MNDWNISQNYKRFIVYMHVSPSGKKYVGITGKEKPEDRWQNGKGYKNNEHFNNAIKKYGWNNFEHIILHSNLSQEEAEELEKYYIQLWDLTNHNYGYNCREGGGSHGKLTEEAKMKISQNHADVSGKNNPMYGVHRYGKDNPNWHNRGKNSPLYGRKMTEEAKEKLRKTKEKKVFCITTGKTYDSITKASIATGISLSMISNCCNRKQVTANGTMWCFLEDKNSYITKDNNTKKSVKCIETNIVYDSITNAAKCIGLKDGSGISNCCKGKRKTAGGCHWEYIQ